MSEPFLEALCRRLCDGPLRERILLAPSLRVGRQWLERVARRRGVVGGARLATLRGLIRNHADAALRARRLRVPSPDEALDIVAESLRGLHGSPGRRPDAPAAAGAGDYFAGLPPSLSLARSVLAALDELSLAGVDDPAALARHARPAAKARELAALQAGYRAGLARAGLADPGTVCRLARQALENAAAPDSPPLVIPAWIGDEAAALEREFLRAWPGEILSLPDESGTESAVSASAEAPRAGVEWDIFSADSAANEVRGILRRLHAEGAPLDSAEVVCADPSAYVPLFCAIGAETFPASAAAVVDDDDGDGTDTPKPDETIPAESMPGEAMAVAEDLPITFAGGLPAIFARPARLLAAWLQWQEDGFPAEGLARLVASGLLGSGWRSGTGGAPDAGGLAEDGGNDNDDGHGDDTPAAPLDRLAAYIRNLPIRGTWADYARAADRPAGEGENAASRRDYRFLFERLVAPLFDRRSGLPARDGRLLAAALALLELPGGWRGELDGFVHLSLARLLRAARERPVWKHFSARAWLREELSALRVMGSGPQPGKLHVGGLDGGQSGRRRVFLAGFDDARFPGADRQDPILLDDERRGLGEALATSSGRRRKLLRSWRRLLSGLRGHVTFSYARSDPETGRERYPADVLAALAGDGQETAAAAPEVLLPAASAACLDERDDWLRALPARPEPRWRPECLAVWRPNLGAGLAAAARRLSDDFTAHDGHVPQAGADWLARPAAAQTLTASALERLGANPQGFLFRDLLGLRPPERFDPAAARWLPPAETGLVLHETFSRFIGLAGAGEATDAAGERETLARCLAEALAPLLPRFPPGDNPLAQAREMRELEEACDIFLRLETRRRREGCVPLRAELSLGGDDDPVLIKLPGGAALPCRGRLDRVDRRGAGMEIVDYKTGRPDKYRPDDPFAQGRQLQPLVYTLMLRARPETAGADAAGAMDAPPAPASFTYLFTKPGAEGGLVTYVWDEPTLREGLDILRVLYDLLSTGRFPPNGADKDALARGDYAALYEDAARLAEAANAKRARSRLLEDWRRLGGKV